MTSNVVFLANENFINLTMRGTTDPWVRAENTAESYRVTALINLSISAAFVSKLLEQRPIKWTHIFHGKFNSLPVSIQQNCSSKRLVNRSMHFTTVLIAKTPQQLSQIKPGLF